MILVQNFMLIIKNHIKIWLRKSTEMKLLTSKVHEPYQVSRLQVAHLSCNWIPGFLMLLLDLLTYWPKSVYLKCFW